MLKSVFERGHVAESDEEAKDNTKNQHIECKAVGKRKEESGSAHADDRNEWSDAMRQGEYLEVASEDANIGHDKGKRIDDCEIADGEISLLSLFRYWVP